MSSGGLALAAPPALPGSDDLDELDEMEDAERGRSERMLEAVTLARDLSLVEEEIAESCELAAQPKEAEGSRGRKPRPGQSCCRRRPRRLLVVRRDQPRHRADVAGACDKGADG